MPSVKAKKGEKTIEVRIYFFTNNISKKKGEINQKECWESGRVMVTPNKSHGIKSKRAETFSSVSSLTRTIEKVLISQNIKIHPGKQTKQLYI